MSENVHFSHFCIVCTVPSRIRNASSVYTAYESFAPLTLIIRFCPCFINRVSRVF